MTTLCHKSNQGGKRNGELWICCSTPGLDWWKSRQGTTKVFYEKKGGKVTTTIRLVATLATIWYSIKISYRLMSSSIASPSPAMHTGQSSGPWTRPPFFNVLHWILKKGKKNEKHLQLKSFHPPQKNMHIMPHLLPEKKDALSRIHSKKISCFPATKAKKYQWEAFISTLVYACHIPRGILINQDCFHFFGVCGFSITVLTMALKCMQGGKWWNINFLKPIKLCFVAN